MADRRHYLGGGPELLAASAILLALFTRVRGRGVLRNSPVRGPERFGQRGPPPFAVHGPRRWATSFCNKYCIQGMCRATTRGSTERLSDREPGELEDTEQPIPGPNALEVPRVSPGLGAKDLARDLHIEPDDLTNLASAPLELQLAVSPRCTVLRPQVTIALSTGRLPMSCRIPGLTVPSAVPRRLPQPSRSNRQRSPPSGPSVARTMSLGGRRPTLCPATDGEHVPPSGGRFQALRLKVTGDGHFWRSFTHPPRTGACSPCRPGLCGSRAWRCRWGERTGSRPVGLIRGPP
jgi:hypothetical protein